MRVIGIDPGLVHTGLVEMDFDPAAEMLLISEIVGIGPVPSNTLVQVKKVQPSDLVFIEAYRPRSHFNTDAAMVKAVNDFKSALPHAKVLDNTGVTKVVTNQMLRALELWRFTKATNHQDLRSAARIAILGMLKSEDTNKIVFQYMDAYLNETPWKVFRV